MPTYDYKCRDCGTLSTRRVEIRFRDAIPCDNPRCIRRDHATLHRFAGAPSIQFKGSGFYVNDYKRKT